MTSTITHILLTIDSFYDNGTDRNKQVISIMIERINNILMCDITHLIGIIDIIHSMNDIKQSMDTLNYLKIKIHMVLRYLVAKMNQYKKYEQDEIYNPKIQSLYINEWVKRLHELFCIFLKTI